jgi:hypothetical protein
MNKHVVCWDPSGAFWDGAIVDRERVNDLETKGVALLPCEPEIFSYAGCSGFAKRSWGSGWPLGGAAPQAICPIELYWPGEPFRTIHWKARLLGEKGQGIPIRLAPAASRGNVVRPVIRDLETKAATNAVDVANLGDADAAGGWTIGGVARIDLGSPCMFGVCLYGVAPGMRVAWLAATLTP